ncbi:MAG: hypothetical protein DRP70_01515 [Spirochaetes bacterium]|nr:MAG: hypothetical protein DRP70_01515 [Spirochaetota bacterium]RKX98160.1 MAG: hypothetical protein DRZ90_03850 [Spirochaetota bacterium]
MNIFIVIILGVLMLAAAGTALYMKSLSAAVIAAGAVSLLASVLYLLLAAPDVAMTEAAIGSALTTVVFLYALSRMRGTKKEDPRD